MQLSLKEKIESRQAVVGIIGLGYVGLPLAITIGNAGFKTIGIEKNADRVEILKKGTSYIPDLSSDELQQAIAKGVFIPTSDISEAKNVDIIIICVPTPLDKYKIPDVTYIEDATTSLAPFIKEGHLVIFESTTYPGCTEEFVKPILERGGLVAGKDFYLAFSPERVDPGNEQYPIAKIPKVVGGISGESTDLAALFYGKVVTKVHPVSSLRAAEMSKLLENVFRLINISFINEFKLMCDKMGLDVWEIIEAAKTKPYGFMPFYPGPGVGGHCIPDDPFYLSWKAREYGFYARFIELAGEINELMPHAVTTKAIWALNQHKKALNGSTVLVLGVAYKKNINDLRESPALTVIEDLVRKKANVMYHDIWVPSLTIDGKKFTSQELSDDLLKKADLVLILTDHDGIDYEKLSTQCTLIVDTRNAIKSRLANVVRI